MGLVNAIVGTLAVSGAAVLVGLQVLIRRRGASMVGTVAPRLPGPLGERITASSHALVYFYGPTCAACRALTPVLTALEQRNPSVFAVDVTRELELARALNVMATPSTVELQQGRIVSFAVGPIPSTVLARFRPAEALEA